MNKELIKKLQAEFNHNHGDESDYMWNEIIDLCQQQQVEEILDLFIDNENKYMYTSEQVMGRIIKGMK